MALICSVLTSLYQNDQGVQKASAQNDDQHFKDCRSKILELGNRMSEAGDRAPHEDVRTEVAAIMTEALVLQSDCGDVGDRLMQDPAVKFQTEYLLQRAEEFE